MNKNIFIAIVGRTNTGKSSLMNLLVGEKVTIVSGKPQTTRTRINGMVTRGETQFVFVDTPGMHKGKTQLSKHMIRTATESIKDVDLVFLMVDSTKKISPAEKEFIRDFSSRNQPVFLLLNKVDLVKDKSLLLKTIEEYSKLYDFKEIIPISVVKKIATDKLFDIAEKYALEGEHFYPADMTTDQSERLWISEIVREKVLHHMHEEIPHGVAVEVESLETRTTPTRVVKDIGVVIICEKDSHKGMIIGKQGSKLKTIATLAREELENHYGEKVNLQCFVKIKADWRNRESFIAEMGLSNR